MSSRYHPISDSIWDDAKLEGLPFEGKAFFVFLCSCTRQRPSGIYRATDTQLAADTGIPEKRVKAHLADLHQRGRIVRDGAWIFVRNYFRRQPKQDRLLSGVESDVMGCDSIPILEAFAEQYPLYRRWSIDRLQTVNNPVNGFVPSEQYQSRAVTEQSRAVEATPLGVGILPPPEPKESPDDLLAVWNAAAAESRKNGLPGLRPCKVLNDTRRKGAVLRLREAELEWHRQAIGKLARSVFASGGGKPTEKHPKPFRASFGWYVRNDENCVRAHEGHYDE